jgi:hypothetical protein
MTAIARFALTLGLYAVTMTAAADEMTFAPQADAASPSPACPCEGGDCARRASSGINGGFSFYVLRPFIDNNQAAVTTTSTTISPTQATVTRRTDEFSWDYSTSPMVWLGWKNCDGWGWRTRLFCFNQNSKDVNLSLGPTDALTTQIRTSSELPDVSAISTSGQGSPGVLLSLGEGVDHLRFYSGMILNNWDLETTYDMSCGPYSLVWSAGLRYMFLSQHYGETLTNTATVLASPVAENTTLDFGHSFNGVGPTIGLEASRQLGCSCWSLFGTVRGTLLVGNVNRSLSFSETISDPDSVIGGDQSRTVSAISDQTGTLPVAEIEMGAEYARTIACHHTFARAALVEQAYFDAGSAASTDGNLNLFGFQFSVGLNY